LRFGDLEETSPGVDLRVLPSAPINGRLYWEIDVESADAADAETSDDSSNACSRGARVRGRAWGVAGLLALAALGLRRKWRARALFAIDRS